MEFKDLEYIALEGGGGKGVVYLGAIEALEELCKDDTNLEALGKKKALLDYKIIGKDELKIKGIAGSSAGSITAFALALGLNSTEITEVLNYPFANFLKEKDVGKYRMVGSDNELYIAEDKSKKIGGHKKKFQYSLRDYQKVSGNPLKYILRNSLITLAIESIVEGLMTKVDFVQKLITQKDVKNWFGENDFMFKLLNLKLPESNYLEASSLRKVFTYIGIFKLLQILLTKVVWKKKINKPFTIDMDTIGNMVCDRGAFSGVAVREFFYDLILYAFTRDTYFQRQFINWFYGGKEKKLSAEVLKAKQAAFSCEGFSIGKSRSTNYESFKTYFDSNKLVFDRLQSLTFREFFEITNLNLGFNITNFTTDSPMLFSHIHTPDFPILEAVAASMSIPPAIKPLYTEAVAFKVKGFDEKNINVSVGKVETEAGVRTESGLESQVFTDKDGNFNLDDYYLYEKAVKIYLSKNNRFKIRIDTNNTLNNSNFLDLLLDAFVDNYLDGSLDKIISKVQVENSMVGISCRLLIFYYNAAYKGMFMDGGVTCNIPYYFFRKKEMIKEAQSGKEAEPEIDSLQGVLAVKLDNTFPPEWILTAKDILNKSGDKFTSVAFLDKEQRSILGNLFRAQFRVAFFKNINKRAKKAIKNSDLNLDDSLKNLSDKSNKEAWEKIAEEITANFRKKNKLKPWEKQKGILALIGTLQYGSEDGQIKFLSDHNHIISLYSYGIGVYDFELKKFESLIKLAQKHAKIKVKEFFTN